MNRGVELQEVQVKGTQGAEKKAINTKNNLGITNIRIYDQDENFPELRSMIDALKRISGINVPSAIRRGPFGMIRDILRYRFKLRHH